MYFSAASSIGYSNRLIPHPTYVFVNHLGIGVRADGIFAVQLLSQSFLYRSDWVDEIELVARFGSSGTFRDTMRNKT